MLDTHLNVVQCNRRRRSGDVGKGAGAQQLYHDVGSSSMRRKERSEEGRCAKIRMFDTHLHAAQHIRRRRSGGVGEGAGVQQLYHYVGS